MYDSLPDALSWRWQEPAAALPEAVPTPSRKGTGRPGAASPGEPERLLEGPLGARIQAVALPPFGSLTLEYTNAAAAAFHPDVGCVDQDQSLEDIHAAGRKLLAGLRLIETVSPEAALLVARWSIRIVARKDVHHYREFGSYSSRLRRGDIGVVNAQLRSVDVPQVADAILHEGIHAFLHYLEGQEPLIVPRRSATVVSSASSHDAAHTLEITDYPLSHIPSPWTGRSLPLRTYLHACCVWYGLSCFWLRCIESAPAGAPPHARARELADAALAGFGKGDLVAPLARLGSISAAALSMVARMQRRILDLRTCGSRQLITERMP